MLADTVTRQSRIHRQNLTRILLLFCLLPALTSCSWTIVPPEPEEQSETVFLSVYGRHTRLALPHDESGYVEYGFGDWHYYALGERDWLTGLRALFFSSASTLSRRELPDPGQAVLRNHFHSKRTEAIEVHRADVRQLLHELEQAWSESDEVRHGNGQLTFKQTDRQYSLFHNSNHQTAQWLEQLQCEVRGTPISSDFRLLSASESGNGQ